MASGIYKHGALINCPEIYIMTSTLRQRGIQIILHWVPGHVNIEGNDRADELANEVTGLEVVEPD